MLSLFPTIRSLEIHPPFDVNAIMQAMTCIRRPPCPSESPRACLGWVSDYYHTTKDYRLSCSGFKSMVLSRWWPDSGGSASFRNGLSRLQKVTLRGFRVDSVEDITPLSALSGLVFDYTAIKEC
ncbi:hypothetical protein BT96DRAFT_987894 [Gymnopus androsaceus JB14]|uniref:F-box domain-containing protein n=1 Tax=Gymnopus androsaceus JB14 TaxID=1447944 RepID=A0A6A4IAU4_9AGAR|nr:hypothetical protein BT96DRAFT_987894 [Gymnopus androsaceus JB14]